MMKPKKILIVFVNGIGDAVMNIPVLRAIHHKFGDAKIEMLCQGWAPKLLAHTKLIDKFHVVRVPWTLAADKSAKSLLKLAKTVWNLRKEKFDMAIHFRGDPRSILLMYLCGIPNRISYGTFKNKTYGKYFLTSVVPLENKGSHIMDWGGGVARYLGCEEKHFSDITMPISEEQMKYAKRALKNLDICPGDCIIIGIHPGHRTDVRGWRIERWRQVIEYLYKRFSAKILVFGSEADKDVLEQLAKSDSRNIIPINEPLKYLPAFIKLCRLIICLDSAASHIAAAVETTSIVLFGPNSPSISAPRGTTTRIIIKDDFKCRPCLQRSCVYPQEQGSKIGACMAAISVADVIDVIDKEISM